MKVRVTYKSPDALHYAVEDALVDFEGDRHERSDEHARITDQLIDILGSSEYLTIEVDLETGTTSVVKRQ